MIFSRTAFYVSRRLFYISKTPLHTLKNCFPAFKISSRSKHIQIHSFTKFRHFSVFSKSFLSVKSVNDGYSKNTLRKFHTSQRRNVMPQVWVVLKLFLKGGSIITGRGFRQWWKTLPDKKRLHFIHLSKKQWKEILFTVTALCLLVFGFYWTHLQVAPITGRERFIPFNDKQFLKVVEFEAETLQTEMKDKYLPLTHPYYKVVVDIVQRLVKANQDIEGVKSLKWTIAIIDDPEINAFILPTGHVFVNKGLIDFVFDDNQLAIVLGHEMAHALLKHGAEGLAKTQLVDYGVIMLMAMLWAFIPTDGIAVITQWFLHKVVDIMIHMPYNRALETEADKVGLELAAKACYDIRMGTVFWVMMSVNSELKGEDRIEWLSTHPASDKRAEVFDHYLPKYIEMRKECNCQPLSDTDPRLVIPYIKEKRDNVKRTKLANSNVERFKIPLSQYKPSIPPAALVGNSLTGTQSEVAVEILNDVPHTILSENTQPVSSASNVSKSQGQPTLKKDLPSKPSDQDLVNQRKDSKKNLNQ